MILSARSEDRLEGVNPALVRVVRRAAVLIDTMFPGLEFIVTEGLRSVERQKHLVQIGASWTMKSMHLVGRAVDLAAVVGREVRWDWPLYYKLEMVMKQAAHDEGLTIEWGGNWAGRQKDGPHFQLSDKVKA